MSGLMDELETPQASPEVIAAAATDSRQELEAAFNLFNRLSLSLEEAYGTLEDRVASLDAELRVARQEREVQRAEKEQIAERLAGLLAELPAGVVLVGAEGRVEEANPAGRTMLNGLEAGRSWEAVVQQNLVSSSTSGDMVSQARRRITLTRRELAGGACVVVLTDVTQIHELQERVGRNQRLTEMGEMAARLAHQIRTPISAAMLYASGLACSAEETTRRNSNRILERLRHLETMINDMLMFAKGGAGELEQLTVLQLFESVHEAVDPRVRPTVSTDDLTSGQDVRVLVNKDRMTGALVNLVNNAIECGAEKVILGARSSSEGYLELSVIDDGPGIAPDLETKIFDPFFTTRSGGTGLGLAVVRSAVESVGGSIIAERSRYGGACFLIRLPLASFRPDENTTDWPAAMLATGG